jgi:hypothetical protein
MVAHSGQYGEYGIKWLRTVLCASKGYVLNLLRIKKLTSEVGADIVTVIKTILNSI